jgi:hypothetical protein
VFVSPENVIGQRMLLQRLGVSVVENDLLLIFRPSCIQTIVADGKGFPCKKTFFANREISEACKYNTCMVLLKTGGSDKNLYITKNPMVQTCKYNTGLTKKYR